MQAKHNVEKWTEENKHLFSPPVCNKLMYKKQLSVMFVGGPNTRTDFHIEEGSEFFYQLKGDMELPTVQAGKRKLVKIREGDRPNAGSLGLVVERERTNDESDCLRWYKDFTTCDQILWQKFFHCDDLGKDLVPVVTAFKESEAFKTNVPDASTVPTNPPLKQDMNIVVPDPFPFKDWLQQHKQEFYNGQKVNLFPGHPDKEFLIEIFGGGKDKENSFALNTIKLENWLYQLKGKSVVKISFENKESEEVLNEGDCGILLPGTSFSVVCSPDSLLMSVVQDPHGNRQ